MKFLRSLPFWAIVMMMMMFATTTVHAEFGEDVCWKNSYGRQVGLIPDSCAPGREKSGALCYQKCGPNRVGEANGCWSACPAGFEDRGVFCLQNRQSECPPTTIKTIVGTCTKTNEWRDLGVPLVCGGGKQDDAGLCYDKCRTGFSGVGPVCWGTCTGANNPADPAKPFSVDCAAMCATTADECAIATTNIVLSTLEMIGSVASMVATGGAATAAKAAATTAVKVSLKLAKDGAKGATKAVIKDITTDAAKNSIKKAAQKAGQSYTETQLSNMAKASVGLEDVDWSMLDPTGIAGMVQAYDKPICGAPGQTTKTRNIINSAGSFSPFDSFQYLDHSGRRMSAGYPQVIRDELMANVKAGMPDSAEQMRRMEARLSDQRVAGRTSRIPTKLESGSGFVRPDGLDYVAPNGVQYVAQMDADGYWIHQPKADFEQWIKDGFKGTRVRAHRDNIIHYKSWDNKFYQAAWNGEIRRWQIKAL